MFVRRSSFGSRGRVDADDSAEAEHRCGAALGLKESERKADRSRIISLSNLCSGVGGCQERFLAICSFMAAEPAAALLIIVKLLVHPNFSDDHYCVKCF